MNTMGEVTERQTAAYLNGEVELKDLLGLSPEYVADLRGRAQFFLDGGHDERALIMLELLEDLDRTDMVPTLLAVDVLLRLGRSDAAQAKADALSACAPQCDDAQVACAKVKLAIGEWARAAQLLKGVLARDPQARTSAGRSARALANEAYARFEASR